MSYQENFQGSSSSFDTFDMKTIILLTNIYNCSDIIRRYLGMLLELGWTHSESRFNVWRKSVSHTTTKKLSRHQEFYNSVQFSHYLLGDVVRFQRVRAWSYTTTSLCPHFRHQSLAQAVTWGSELTLNQRDSHNLLLGFWLTY